MLPLTFANPSDYDKILEDDKLSIPNLSSLAPEKQVQLIVKHKDGSVDEIVLNHSFNAGQVEWFKSGGALNLIAAKQKAQVNRKKATAKKKVVKKLVVKKTKPTTKKAAVKKKAVKPVRRGGKVVKKIAAKKPVKPARKGRKVIRKKK